jgi:ferredoxin--NADP+ reductase
LLSPAQPTREALEKLLFSRGCRVVSFTDWQILDRIELAQGIAADRLRVKLSRVDAMLEALEKRTHSSGDD